MANKKWPAQIREIPEQILCTSEAGRRANRFSHQKASGGSGQERIEAFLKHLLENGYDI